MESLSTQGQSGAATAACWLWHVWFGSLGYRLGTLLSLRYKCGCRFSGCYHPSLLVGYTIAAASSELPVSPSWMVSLHRISLSCCFRGATVGLNTQQYPPAEDCYACSALSVIVNFCECLPAAAASIVSLLDAVLAAASTHQQNSRPERIVALSSLAPLCFD